MRTISVRLDDRTDGLLTAYCRQHSLTQTEAVKAAIEHLAARPRLTPAELAERFGLIGAFDSNDPELATRHSDRVNEVLRRNAHRDSRRADPGSTKGSTRRKVAAA